MGKTMHMNIAYKTVKSHHWFDTDVSSRVRINQYVIGLLLCVTGNESVARRETRNDPQH